MMENVGQKHAELNFVLLYLRKRFVACLKNLFYNLQLLCTLVTEKESLSYKKSIPPTANTTYCQPTTALA